jgi:Clp amino terminal domain, pathogenicity island component
MFNLDQEIRQWRQRMVAGGIHSDETLDELEAHLREDVERRISSGVGGAHAFAAAVGQIGHPGELGVEFKKIGGSPRRWLRRVKEVFLRAPESPFPSLDHFGSAARRALEIAPDEARRFHHDFVGTEHVLLGLIQSTTGSVANVMRRLGVDAATVRAEIAMLVGTGLARESSATIPFTPRARRALRLATIEAKALHHEAVKEEHILLGLLLEGGGVAALVLKNLGVNAAAARKEILKELSDSAPPR